jgi:hypothetical protein
MPAFDAYDYVGYIVPGAVLLIGLMLLFPAMREQFAGQKLDLSDLGILIILSFALGQILHQVGHVIDKTDLGRVYYTEKVFCKKDSVLSAAEETQLQGLIKARFNVDASCITDATDDVKTHWRNIVKQMYIDINRAKLSERVDIFNRSVGLHLALGTVFAVLFCICLAIALGSQVKVEGFKGIRSTLCVGDCKDTIKAALVLAALAGASYICFARMHYFAKAYASELFLVYLYHWSPSSPL